MKITKTKILSMAGLFFASLTYATTTYTLVDAGEGAYNIEKYVENDDGTYSTVTYGVSFGTDDIGDTTGTNGTSYYLWDSSTNSYTTTGADADNYDIVVTANRGASGTTLTASIMNATSESSPAVVTNGSAYDGGAYVKANPTFSANTLYGIFVANSANSTSDQNVSYGGAISLTGSGNGGSYVGAFIGNSATYTSAKSAFSATGGAIHIGGSVTVNSISADFLNNYATAKNLTNAAYGGAINNAGTITSLTGDFIANYAYSASSYAYGGAIRNAKTITSLTGDFLGNYASTLTGTAQGGAIYNTGAITFNATSSDMQFTGNYVETDGVKTSNAIYNTGTLNFTTSEKYSIVVNDGISGSSGTMTISGAGTTVFNNSVSSQDITVNDGATLALGSVVVDGVDYSASISSSTINLLEGSTLVIAADTTISFTDVIWNIASAADEVSAISVMSLSSEEVADAYLANAVIDLSSVSDLSSFEIDLDFDNDADATLFNALLTDGGEIDFTFDGETVVTAAYDSLTDSYVLEDGDYSASFSMSTSGGTITVIGTAAVPEPSTYAMIFGVVALGFAAYRRRK